MLRLIPWGLGWLEGLRRVAAQISGGRFGKSKWRWIFWPVVAQVVVILPRLYAIYKTLHVSNSNLRLAKFYTPHEVRVRALPLPDLIIYRRTKRSGSSSILVEMRGILEPLTYKPFHLRKTSIDVLEKQESIWPNARRIIVADYSDITRHRHPYLHAVVADTGRDG